MASDLIKQLSDASFEADVLKSSTPVLVDYWAEWCGPCKMIAPILDDVAGAYQGKLTVAKIDGADVLGSDHALAEALADAGFRLTPQGLRLRR